MHANRILLLLVTAIGIGTLLGCGDSPDKPPVRVVTGSDTNAASNLHPDPNAVNTK